MRNSPEANRQGATVPELVSRSLEGDLSAFRTLMESHQQYAYAVAFGFLRDEDHAKDVVQQAFIRVWNNLGRYRMDMKFTTWLYKIVINLCYDKTKMESRRKKIFGHIGGLFGSNDFADGDDLQEQVETADLREHVLREAKKLSPKEYLVFHLRDVQDFSIEEVAETVGISVGSVKTNLCHARRRIRMAVSSMLESESI